MSRVSIRAGKVADAIALAPRLRPEDALEVSLATGEDVEKSLLDSVRLSDECFAGVLGGQVIALGGVTFIKGWGIPWLVASPEALKFPITLVDAGRAAVARWEKSCDVLFNYTHVDNVTHHKWLKHIGFTVVSEAVPYGASQEPFFQFYRHSNV